MKKKSKDPLHGKRDPESQLYRAVRRYVKSKNGTITVIGGIEVQRSFDLERRISNYTIGIRCLGKMPGGYA